MNSVRISSRLLPEEGDLKPIVVDILACIDAIHAFPDFPAIPIRFTDILSPFAAYIPGDGRPARIELSRLGPHPRLSLAHEIGHLLDHTLGNFDVYSSRERSSSLASALGAIEQSQAVAILRDAYSKRQTTESGVPIR